MGVTVLIPTYNMSEHLGPLCESILRTGLLDSAGEVLIVDDASSDATPQILDHLIADSRFGGKIKSLRLPENRGRFHARHAGAKAARNDWILFLDSRLTLREDFVASLGRVRERGHATVGWVQTDVTKNIFCLYWQRSHERVFRNHYALTEPIELTPANYDRYLKGTGVFLCRTEYFREVCRRFEETEVRSDDTLLLKEILSLDRLFLDPRLGIWWEPRSRLMPFLMRFFERGPGFVEYHVFHSPGRYAVVVFMGLAILAAWIVLVLLAPVAGVLGLLGGLAAIALTALAFGKTAAEGLRLMPLHLLVVLFFGFGVLRGLALNIAKVLNKS